jgi:hypothetical protein
VEGTSYQILSFWSSLTCHRINGDNDPERRLVLTDETASRCPAPGLGVFATLHAFDKSVGKLGVDQLDLLLHQPLSTAFDRTLAPTGAGDAARRRPGARGRR